MVDKGGSMDDTREVLGNVLIFAVEVEDDAVRVDVYGGDEGICGSVVYHFPDHGRRDDNVATLQRWCDTGTAVTLVRRPGTVTLLDEAAVLSELLDR
jgi:hypothetical protein